MPRRRASAVSRPGGATRRCDRAATHALALTPGAGRWRRFLADFSMASPVRGQPFVIPSMLVGGNTVSGRYGSAVQSVGSFGFAAVDKNKADRPAGAGGNRQLEGKMRLRLDSQGHARLIESALKGCAD